MSLSQALNQFAQNLGRYPQTLIQGRSFSMLSKKRTLV